MKSFFVIIKYDIITLSYLRRGLGKQEKIIKEEGLVCSDGQPY